MSYHAGIKPFRQNVSGANGERIPIRLPRHELSAFRRHMLDRPRNDCMRAGWADGAITPRIAVQVAYVHRRARGLLAHLEMERKQVEADASLQRQEMEKALARIRKSEREISGELEKIGRNFEKMEDAARSAEERRARILEDMAVVSRSRAGDPLNLDVPSVVEMVLNVDGMSAADEIEQNFRLEIQMADEHYAEIWEPTHILIDLLSGYERELQSFCRENGTDIGEIRRCPHSQAEAARMVAGLGPELAGKLEDRGNHLKKLAAIPDRKTAPRCHGWKIHRMLRSHQSKIPLQYRREYEGYIERMEAVLREIDGRAQMGFRIMCNLKDCLEEMHEDMKRLGRHLKLLKKLADIPDAPAAVHAQFREAGENYEKSGRRLEQLNARITRVRRVESGVRAAYAEEERRLQFWSRNARAHRDRSPKTRLEETPEKEDEAAWVPEVPSEKASPHGASANKDRFMKEVERLYSKFCQKNRGHIQGLYRILGRLADLYIGEGKLNDATVNPHFTDMVYGQLRDPYGKDGSSVGRFKFGPHRALRLVIDWHDEKAPRILFLGNKGAYGKEMHTLMWAGGLENRRRAAPSDLFPKLLEGNGGANENGNGNGKKNGNGGESDGNNR